jgi:hypothetical protein
MTIRATETLQTLYRYFRSLPFFIQLILIVPVFCGATLFMLIGNMGLALMGTAIAINTFLLGWIASFLSLLVFKCRIDKNKSRIDKK